jgi:hypothetical protein
MTHRRSPPARPVWPASCPAGSGPFGPCPAYRSSRPCRSRSGGAVPVAGLMTRAMADRSPRPTLAESVAGWAEQYPDVDVCRHIVRGRAGAVLKNLSAGAEPLVVGSRGRGGFTGLLLSSVRQAAIHHAGCPVAVVRQMRPTRATTALASWCGRTRAGCHEVVAVRVVGAWGRRCLARWGGVHEDHPDDLILDPGPGERTVAGALRPVGAGLQRGVAEDQLQVLGQEGQRRTTRGTPGRRPRVGTWLAWSPACGAHP